MLTNNNFNSFCPAHWDDIHFAPSQGYVQGCCKSTPLANMDELEVRKQQSLNGIRPEGCKYCWVTEDAGKQSLRDFKISKWDNTSKCRLLTMVLGNLCNMQCTYCNEKFSSRWQSETKREGEMFLGFDREVYYGGAKCDNKESEVYIDFYNTMQPSQVLTVSGGEPLMGTIFYDILTHCDLNQLKEIRVSTNLNYPNKNVLNKLLEFDNTHQLVFNVSLDTVNKWTQEYIRFGFSMEAFIKNLHDILEGTNAKIVFNSLMTANTVLDVYKLGEFVYNLKMMFPDRVGWFPSYCVQPRIHSFEIMNDEERSHAIKEVKAVLAMIPDTVDKLDKEVVQLNGVLAYLESTELNEDLRKDQQSFFEQFSARHDIETPEELVKR